MSGRLVKLPVSLTIDLTIVITIIVIKGPISISSPFLSYFKTTHSKAQDKVKIESVL